KELSGDLAIYTEEGDLALMVYGLRLAPVPKVMLAKRLGSHQESSIRYQLTFNQTPMPELNQNKRMWLLVGDDAYLSVTLNGELTAQGEQVTLVGMAALHHSSVVERLSGSVGVIYLVNPDRECLTSHLWQFMSFVQRLNQSKAHVTRLMLVTEQGLSAQPQDL